MACSGCAQCFADGRGMHVLVDGDVQIKIIKRPGPWLPRYRYGLSVDVGCMDVVPAEGTWLLQKGERVISGGGDG